MFTNVLVGKGYQYDPDTDTGFSGADDFPDDLPRETFSEPTVRGNERAISKRLNR